jgi:hypothetical protein
MKCPGKSLETEQRLVVALRGGRNREQLLVGLGFSFRVMKKVWNRIVMMVAQQCECI